MAILVQLIIVSLAVTSISSAPSPITNGTWHHLTVMIDGDETIVTVAVNEDKGIEMYKTEDPTPALIVKDFNTGVEAIVSDDSEFCYVTPLDSSRNTGPSALKSEVEKSEGEIQTVEDETDELYSTGGYPIVRKLVLGETIAEKCDGRDTFWLIRVPGESGGRTKRDVDCRHVLVCSVEYQNGQWVRSCRYELKCSF